MSTKAMSGAGLLLGMLAVATTGGAANEDFARPGLYAGVGGVYAFEHFDLGDATISTQGTVFRVGADADDSGGFDAHVGYRFHPKFAADDQVQYYDEFGLNVHASGILARSGQVATAQGVAGLSQTDAGPAGRLGVGLDAYLTQNVLLNLETTYLHGAALGPPFSSLGVESGSVCSISGTEVG